MQQSLVCASTVSATGLFVMGVLWLVTGVVTGVVTGGIWLVCLVCYLVAVALDCVIGARSHTFRKR